MMTHAAIHAEALERIRRWKRYAALHHLNGWVCPSVQDVEEQIIAQRSRRGLPFYLDHVVTVGTHTIPPRCRGHYITNP